ncbi:MAG: hypothetical protein K8L99_28080 [Anaerolineae bacterium]|nr:hypothetical protein [Anaerolineae bacterium]
MRFLNYRRAALSGLLLLLLAAFSAVPAFAQDNDVAPAPPSIGADVPLTYFGPAPSDVQRELIGPYQLLKSGPIDTENGTITLPLYRGELTSGEAVWYILTDTNDQGNAAALGLNFSAKLTYAEVGNGVRPAHLESDGTVIFERGAVDFSPERSITPGEQPNPFPPTAFQPGAVGDAFYTPLAKIGNYIYNAPIVAFGVEADQIAFCDGDADHSLVHDKVTAICPDEGTVTLDLTPGFSFARPVLYLSTDASNDMAATMEGAVYAPALTEIGVGRDDSAFSAVERIFAFANGPTGSGNPQRQGFNSALSGEGSPLNVLGGIPTVATDYSPLWDLNLGVWTQEAIDNGYRSRLTEEFAILGFAEQGWITGPDGGDYGSTGIIVNCPIVWRFL